MGAHQIPFRTLEEDMSSAMRGDERGELRSMVITLSAQLAAVASFLNDPKLQNVKQTSLGLAKAAQEYLDK